MNLQMVTKLIGGTLTKNSSTILTGLAVGGLFVTTIMAIKATPKALELVKDIEDKENKYLTVQEIIQTTWKCYVPAGVMLLLTTGCIIGSNVVSLRRNAALASVYRLSEMAMKEYQAKVIETIGSEKARTIKEDIHKDRIENNPVGGSEIIATSKGDTLCYDSLSGRYFKSDIEHIRQVLNKLSRQLLHEDVVTLNDIYSDLNLASTKLGDMLCWHVSDGLIEPEFSSQLCENGEPCLVLDYATEPRYTTY